MKTEGFPFPSKKLFALIIKVMNKPEDTRLTSTRNASSALFQIGPGRDPVEKWFYDGKQRIKTDRNIKSMIELKNS
jgi:hypothetical protein